LPPRYIPKRCDYPLFFGGDPKLPSHVPPKPLFGENLQFKPMESVSAYFLTTDKGIVTKLDQTIKEIERLKL